MMETKKERFIRAWKSVFDLDNDQPEVKTSCWRTYDGISPLQLSGYSRN